MDFFSATTFGFMAPKGFTKNPESLDSLRRMFAGTGSDTLLLPVAALQDHAYSTKIDWTTDDVMSEEDVRACVAVARELGKKVILKAMVNCRDGYWRAYINFFDTYVPCEPQWEDWFRSYTDFNVYLARIAQTWAPSSTAPGARWSAPTARRTCGAASSPRCARSTPAL